MVMWFGFDWPSTAVVVVMTFFRMLVNTVAGLARPEGRSATSCIPMPRILDHPW